jgi:enamine deaminase RidA (YjgF/YER057c/UK114 family)
MYEIAGMPFVPAIRVPAGCDLIFISGVMGLPVSYDDGPADIRSESHRAFRRMKDILELSGATFDDVVLVTKFVADVEKNNAVVAEVMAEYFTNMPTSTTVEVTRLIPPINMEINAIAAVRPQ